MTLALRVDVDTYRGTRDGVPRLLQSLEKRRLRATWFFTVGPDNMGRHAWRLLRPQFAAKMLRSKAVSLYGWEILLRGTLWPGPLIGRGLAQAIRQPISAGHEFGVHAWDHHKWQSKVESMTESELEREFDRAVDELARIAGAVPVCSASPGWRCTERVLSMKAKRAFRWHSDCRGDCSPFHPIVNGQVLTQPQTAVDLPTFDEAVGTICSDADEFNRLILERLRDGKPHVLTTHAESEGGVCAAAFERFLDQVIADGHQVITLGEHLDRCALGSGSQDRICQGTVAGREGLVAVRAS